MIVGNVVVRRKNIQERLLSEIARSHILVGISSTDSKNTRPRSIANNGSNYEQPTNAQLGYIHEFGCGRIPARPFLRPAVSGQQRRITARLRQAVQFALRGEELQFRNRLRQLGIETATAVRCYIVSTQFTPLAPLTVRDRFIRHGIPYTVASIAQLRSTGQYEGLVRPLVDYGNMRDAIDSYVVRD